MTTCCPKSAKAVIDRMDTDPARAKGSRSGPGAKLHQIESKWGSSHRSIAVEQIGKSRGEQDELGLRTG